MTVTKKKTETGPRARSNPQPVRRAPKVAQIERTTSAVLEAAIELLSEVGYRRLTIDLVSQRSGVARSTIYRHWSNIPDLAIAAFDMALGPNPPLPDTGDIRSDLLATYTRLSKILKRSIWGKAMPSLIEATHNDPNFKGLLPKLVDRRREASRIMLQRAKDRGEIAEDADTDWILDALSGMLYHRLLVTGGSLRNQKMIEWAVDSVLSQVKRPPAKSRS